MSEINNIVLEKYPEIFKITQSFLNNPDIELATQDLLIDTCKFFNINKLSVKMKNDEYDIYEPITIYENNNLNMKSDIKDFEKFTKCSTRHISKEEDDFITLCDELFCFNKFNNFNNFDNFDNFDSIDNNKFLKLQETLKNLEYKLEDNNNKYIINYIMLKGVFTYIVLELENSFNNNLSQEDINILLYVFDILKLKTSKESNEKFINDSHKIKELIILNEKMPICLVNKHDHRILEFNEYYKEILPNIADCTYYYELIGKTKEFSIEDSINTKYVQANGKHWVRKNIEITLSDGREAYVVYGKDTLDQIKQLESLDLLTSTLSLKGLENYYNDVIRKSRYFHVLVTLDISHFKNINAKYGFEIGNNILRKISFLIKEALIGEEMFCRINDDKFAIIFRQEEEEFSTDRYLVLKEKFSKLKEGNYYFKNLKIYAGVCPIDKTLEFNILLDRANMARKSIKGHCTKEIAIYDKAIELQIQKDFYVEERMDYAVEHNEFNLFLQPKFNLETNKICGAEALVRWVTSEGMIYPDEFIPLFERNGFISNLDFIIYEKVMQYIKYCLYNELPVYPISMNVSRSHINEVDFAERFMDLIKLYNIPIKLIELEIIETAFMDNESYLKEFIDKLKTYDIKISIDDFGTAYSSLHLLSNLEIDTLKIDKSFLVNVSKEKFEKEKLIIKNIINLSNDLNVNVVCEGIETEDQIEILKSIGCKIGQGYIFSRPIPTKEYEKLYLKK